jgi:hypothetical protein
MPYSLLGKNLAMRKATIGTVLALAIMGVVISTLGVLVTTHGVPSRGNIRVVTPPPPASVQLGIYQDSACTTVVSAVDWGTLDPGATATQSIYLKNEGNVPATLSIGAGNWTPSSAQNYLMLTWDRGGYTLGVGASVQAVLSLAVSSSITNITSFSFDISITASQ